MVRHLHYFDFPFLQLFTCFLYIDLVGNLLCSIEGFVAVATVNRHMMLFMNGDGNSYYRIYHLSTVACCMLCIVLQGE